MSSRTQLERAATDVISILKRISEYSNARVAIIDGLALWNYLRDGRTTQDVDFIINIDSAPQSVKQKLLALADSPFFEIAQYFYYKTPDGSSIQIDITPEWQSPYMPAAALPLKNIPTGVVPYISPTDLIVFKINSCGLRALISKRRIDAGDAQALLEKETRRSPLSLTSRQQEIVEPYIKDVVMHGTMTEEWWRQRLGLLATADPAADYWNWSQEHQNWYHRNDDGTCQWAEQGESSTSQQPKKSEHKGKGRGRGKGRV